MSASYDAPAYFFEKVQNEMGDLKSELVWNASGITPESGGDSDYVPLSQIAPAEEPEKVKKWRQEFLERIDVIDQEESQEMAEMQKISAQQICDWHKLNAEQMKKTWANNRDYDKQLLARREDALRRNQNVGLLEANKLAAQCSTWEEVCSLCDFSSSPKTTKPPVIVRGAYNKNTRRMQSLMLQLQTQPLVR